jgi:hypothetical protein
MKNSIVFYADIDGDIDTVVISPCRDSSTLSHKDGTVYSLYDVTSDGEVYDSSNWIPVFMKECDILFLRYIYLLLEIIDINEYIFPSK